MNFLALAVYVKETYLGPYLIALIELAYVESPENGIPQQVDKLFSLLVLL